MKNLIAFFFCCFSLSLLSFSQSAFNINANMQASVHLSQGSGFEIEPNVQDLTESWGGQKLLSGDFNGDGKEDLVKLYGKTEDGKIKTQAWVHLSTGSSFEYKSSLKSFAGFWDEQKWLTGDFNGDGKDDLVNLYGRTEDGKIKTQAWVHLSTGSSFEYKSSLKSFAGFWDEQKWLTGDFKGSPIPDGYIVIESTSSINCGSLFDYSDGKNAMIIEKSK